MKGGASRWISFLARVISGLWAGLWIFYAVATAAGGYDSRGGATLGWLVFPVIFVALILLLALTAWRWTGIGRVALPLAGLAVIIAYPLIADHFPLTRRLFAVLTLGLPPFSAGVLLIAAWRLERTKIERA